MKCNQISVFIFALLLGCAFPAILGAQPDKTQPEFAPVDTCGNFILFGKKSGSPPRFREFYLENTTTHTRLTLSMDNVYRYDFEHGFLISYGTLGVDVYRADGSLLVKTGMRVLDFLPGDTLFSVYNFESAWKIFSASGELIASGQGTPWYGYTFKQTYDSLIIVPGPNQTVGLINTQGVWLALPVFSRIEVSQKNRLSATIGTRYGTLDPDGIFHEPDSSTTDASVHSIVQGIGIPHKIRSAVENSRDPNLHPQILDVFHEYTIAFDPSPGMGYVLINAATEETFMLPVRQIQSFTFDFPFLRMKYYNAPLYREALLDLRGNLLTENAAYIDIARNGDSTVIACTGREWRLYDWKMNLLTSSGLMNLPEGNAQNIRALSKGLYSVCVILDTVRGTSALYEVADRNGRVITDAVFTNCYYLNNTICVQVCNGLYAKIDTAGNVYYPNDPKPHRVTRESLLSDQSYRNIRIEKKNHSDHRLNVEINPYCYDRHTFEKVGDWEIESWFNKGKLVAQHKKKQKRNEDANRHRTTYHVTEIVTVFNQSMKREKVEFDYSPSWF